MEAGPLKRQENGKEDGFVMNNIVGKGVARVDAYGKVTGEAKYTSDLEPRDCLCARVVHSTIANGLVKRFDLEDALKVPGVVKIVTCFDVPVSHSRPSVERGGCPPGYRGQKASEPAGQALWG